MKSRRSFTCPFCKLTQLFINETQGEAFVEQVIRPTYIDPYTIELLHFHEVITHNVQPKTATEDFLHDLDLFDMIINAPREQLA